MFKSREEKYIVEIGQKIQSYRCRVEEIGRETGDIRISTKKPK